MPLKGDLISHLTRLMYLPYLGFQKAMQTNVQMMQTVKPTNTVRGPTNQNIIEYRKCKSQIPMQIYKVTHRRICLYEYKRRHRRHNHIMAHSDNTRRWMCAMTLPGRCLH